MRSSYTRRQILSSTITRDEAAELVTRFVDSTSDISTRAAGRLAGVSHDTVATWRQWQTKGADPEALAVPSTTTIQGLEAYLGVADEVEIRRAALRLAADRLAVVVTDLRAEAKLPDAGALATSPAAGQKVVPPVLPADHQGEDGEGPQNGESDQTPGQG